VKITFKMPPMDQVARAMGALSERDLKSVSYKATRAGAARIADQFKENIRSAGLVDSGAFLRGVAVARKRTPEYEIGVRHGTVKQIKSGDDPFYWWFHEFGFTHRDGTQVPAKNLLTRAIADQGAQSRAFASLKQSLAKQLLKAFKSNWDQFVK
jgi:hypothetical protein